MCFETHHSEPCLGIKENSKRSCTDLVFLFLWIIFLGGVIFVAQHAIDQGGDPDRVIRGVDMYGRICGKDEGVKDLPLAAWPKPTEYDFKFCTNNCNVTSGDSRMVQNYTSTQFLYYCLPSLNLSISIEVSGDFGSSKEMFTRALGDMYTGSLVISLSPIIALILSILYILFCKGYAGCLVWTVILGLMLAGAGITWGFLEKADEAKSSLDPDRADSLEGLGYTALAITLIFCIIIISMRERIKIAIQVVKEASKALSAMKSLLIFPIWPMLVALGYCAFWIIVALYIYSIAVKRTLDTPSDLQSRGHPAKTVKFKRQEEYNNTLWMHFFGLLWNIQVFIYFTFMVVCGAVADWYFSPKNEKSGKVNQVHAIEADVPWADADGKQNGNGFSRTPVWDSFKRTVRFHLGTIMFGALIIAIINFVRAIVKYIEEKTKEKSSELQKCIFCMIQCCLKCLHCCADKISKNAFVWTSIWGDSFIPAAIGSFELLWANLARVAAINAVGMYLMFLGKLLVAMLTAGIAAMIFNNVDKYKEEMSSPMIPCLIIFIIGYVVATLVMVIFDTTIDTIFLCFLVDAEFNKGGQMLAPKSLQQLIGHYEKESKLSAKRSYEALDQQVMDRRRLNQTNGNEMVKKYSPEGSPQGGRIKQAW